MKHFVIILAMSCQTAKAEILGAGPFAVYNQAYQENTAADTVPGILAQANSAYVLLDPFDEAANDWGGIIFALHAHGNAVGAYISIGTGEVWRSDFNDLRPFLAVEPWNDWAGEYFVSSTSGALPIMLTRIDKIAALGFDWVEFDNMDFAFDPGTRTRYGVATTKSESVDYYQKLCAYAHEKGLRCMAKNVTVGAESFDGVVYESYRADKSWWDQDGGIAFAKAGKPVIIVHYDETDCEKVLVDYRAIYGPTMSFICEDANQKRYMHFND